MRSYLIGIVCAGIVCACSASLFPPKDGVGKLIGLICGLFMTLTILSPFLNFHIADFIQTFDTESTEKETYISNGTAQANSALREVITERCETYIVEKANSMGVNINAHFTLNENDNTPKSVTITGTVPPYAKTVLETSLTNDLGIPKEQQTWK